MERIAIVGAGVSGLVAAHLLRRRHHVVVFERSSQAGGHAHTVRVDTADATHWVDTGFIVFNDRNYPNFERLITQLGVASQPSQMSFSVSDERGRFEYSSRNVNGLFATRRHLLTPSFHRMVAEVPRFQRAARRLLDDRMTDERLSLRDWLASERFSGAFVDRLIAPQVAAVWSMTPEQLWTFPARFLARFFHNHGMLGLSDRPLWRTVTGGTITRDEDGIVIVAGPEGRTERFDHVVIAAHSDEALAMLGDPSERERELLGAIPYQENEAVLHTDAALLPQRERAWASWNYHLLDEPRSRSTVTYHLNRLQSLQASEQFCVTLNLTERIAPTRIIDRFRYAHPVFTPTGIRAQTRIAEISGERRTHFCGAYWGWGFHEDGVRSGLRVAAAFGEYL